MGKKYFTSNYIQTKGSGLFAGVIQPYRSQFNIIAVEANTSIKYQLRKNGVLDNTTTTITLSEAGDILEIQDSLDLTGSVIESFTAGSGQSCKKIAVFSGSSNINIGKIVGTNNQPGSSTDPLFQQCYPVNTWGKSFGLVPFVSATSSFQYRVIAAEDNTTINIDGTIIKLNSGEFYPSFPIGANTQQVAVSSPFLITADKPISVAQYMLSSNVNGYSPTNNQGDPEMVILNPIEQNISDISVFSSKLENITVQYLNIFTKYSNISSFRINGSAPKIAPVRLPAPNDEYAYLIENLSTYPTNSFRLTANDGFNGICYGIGNVESYGYSAGTSLRDFTPTAIFQNPFGRIDSSVTCINTPLQFSVPLSFVPTTIKWDFSAAPNIAPATAIGPLASFTADSSKSLNGQKLSYYSPGKTFTFTNANSAALRDTIKLYTTSATPDGCGSTDQIFTIPVTVKDLPVAKFTVAAGGCANDPVTLTDQSTATQGTIKRWFWDFGDGTTADLTTATVPPKVYNSPAAYTIKLKAVSDIGCLSAEVSQTVQQSAKPVANFSASTLRCIDKDVVFTDASTTATGTLAKWTWDLADGKTVIVNSSNAAVTTQYTSDGVKAVSLKVATTTGCESDPYKPAFAINPSPQPGFTLPEVCLSDAFAVFTDTSKISDGSEAQFKYQWNFNAGTPAVSPGPNISSSTLKNPQIKYAKSDVYKVSLTLTSKDGCVASLVQDFTVNGSIPKAAFDFANAAPYCGVKPVKLRNNSTVDFGGVTRLEIYWDFANAPTVKEVDENPVPGKIYPHAYPDPTAPKTYTIRLVAYSGGTACVDGTTQTITVYPQPKAAFNVSASQLCYGDIVNFTDKSYAGSSAISKWVWDLGGGASSAVQNPNKQFNDSGSFITRLYFFNNDGCISDTATQSLTVYPNPKLLLPHMITVLAGGQVTLTPTYVFGNELSYLWTPPTYLSSDTAATPKAIPDDDITYQLKLTARGGCSVTDTIFIRVLKGPEVPNAFSPNGDGIHDTWKIKYLDGYPGATIDVYNRYGQIVFRSLGYDKEWDGTRNGNPLPVGTYYYIINPRNGRQIITGSVTLIK
ncbi:MAG: gliding motility-associated C-terminal domain-containing protein [Chitinophagaceae bacterium]|nr:gliding motility-associated C-terminal domain-containing protein [Chitinophagaceae bacterium]MCA6458620.1 gliding motility-associated C-terminal domain-containing protein [Chitinophagaceae bacterium]MCA6464964.1 gliding motility-associated C-terminal domain-containing protein [Chitinophagaceae bacterium]